jgi:hypothetical protein
MRAMARTQIAKNNRTTTFITGNRSSHQKRSTLDRALQNQNSIPAEEQWRDHRITIIF